MTREIDVKIARLDGCRLVPCDSGLCDFHCLCNDLRHVSGPTEGICRYSTNLNALMELIRRRWPKADVELGQYSADLWIGTGSTFFAGGDTDAERLANAVVQAMEAECE